MGKVMVTVNGKKLELNSESYLARKLAEKINSTTRPTHTSIRNGVLRLLRDAVAVTYQDCTPNEKMSLNKSSI